MRAREWEQATATAASVLRGQDLEAAERWLTETDERKEPQPTRLHAEYVLASRQAATRAQRIRVGALAIALVVVAGLAVVALVQRNRAEERARVARSRELAAAAQLELASNPDAALVLAVEANEVAPTSEAEVALRQGLEEPHPEVVFRGHRGAVYSAAYSSDGRLLVTASADGTARIWSADNGRPVRTIRPRAGIVTSADFSRDGRRLVTTTGHGAVDIWDPATGRRLASPRAPPGKIRAATFSRDGALLVTGGDDGVVRVWDAQTANQINRFEVPRGRVVDASFGPDGGSIIAVGGDQAARTWDLQTGHQGPTLEPRLRPER